MKAGANFQDINEINRLAEAGMSPSDISQKMVIELSVVKNLLGIDEESEESKTTAKTPAAKTPAK